MDSAIVGREAELSVVGQLLDGVRGASPMDGRRPGQAHGRLSTDAAVLVLWGEAGIGKTTVWSAAVDNARERGFTVLASRPTAVEIRLSHAGLADLLADVDGHRFEGLPRPQRVALDAALLRGGDEHEAADPRAVAAGFLSLLEGLVGDGPVMVAIDDVQWLDEPSRQVVEFAVRRCDGPVAVLAAARADEEPDPVLLRPPDPARRRTVRVGPLSLGALHHVLKQHTGRNLSRRALVRIAEASGGNPFFALELARSLDADAPDVAALPHSLRALVRQRLEQLAPAVRDALVVASALTTPRMEVVARALDGAEVGRALDGAEVVSLLGQAEDAGVVQVSAGVVRFTHPLLAAGVYSSAVPSVRRDVHRRVSRLVDDPEERARHLALAAVAADPETVAALDAAAAHARRRGAPAAASELLELAVGLGAGDPARRVQAARDHFHAGDPGRARLLLEAAIAELDPGPLRAEALTLLGSIRFEVDADPEASALLGQAMSEAGDDPLVRCPIALELAYLLAQSSQVGDALPPAETAVADAETVGDQGLLAEALAVLTIVHFALGNGIDDALLNRALALEDPHRSTRVIVWPSAIAGLLYVWAHRHEDAKVALAAASRRWEDQGGREGELWFVSQPLLYLACASGDLTAAERHVAALVENANLSGTAHTRGVARVSQAWLWGWVGRTDDARAAGLEALEVFSAGASASFPMFALTALGMIELSVGDYGATAEHLAPAAKAMAAWGIGDPAIFPFLPDAVEALVALGRLDEAEPLVDLLEERGHHSQRTWSRAVGARCQALLVAAEGRLDDALETFQQALTAHDRLPQLRYDRARTLLLLGQLQRRRKQRRDARASLDEAAHLFDEVGAAGWAQRAREELERLGLRGGSGDELTATELRVAELAASGLTNKEVAAALFVSPKTVEAHLGRVYRKLGLRSRVDLARALDADEGRGS